ncbi:MAG TPA: carboxymuconolactone decarboxylase family protein [Hyphomicrobiales bacterium]|nr:carboxymuconolactone decarboxylase family protein [Hyphomicrobiales bacterium]
MRLAILDRGHSLGTKLLFAVIGAMTRQPVPELIKLLRYRPDFFGDPMKVVTHEAMRGPSAWSVADRELMAAVVSRVNACEFCIGAHTATSTRAYGDAGKVAAVLADPANAPVEQPLRATLAMLAKLTREQAVDAGDMRAVLAAGASPRQVEDALAVAFAFNVINRLADSFAFAVPGPKALDSAAKFLLARGYR